MSSSGEVFLRCVGAPESEWVPVSRAAASRSGVLRSCLDVDENCASIPMPVEIDVRLAGRLLELDLRLGRSPSAASDAELVGPPSAAALVDMARVADFLDIREVRRALAVMVAQRIMNAAVSDDPIERDRVAQELMLFEEGKPSTAAASTDRLRDWLFDRRST